MVRQDLRGRRFGRLVVLDAPPVEKRKPCGQRYLVWSCVCDCGNHADVIAGCLTSGNTLSCGCVQKERARKAKTTHGESYDRLYTVWRTILARCHNPNTLKYKDYGGRGIHVCDEWQEWSTFSKWAYGNGYDKNAPYGKCTIDRIDVDGDYCPKNCRWVPLTVQAKNTRAHKRKREMQEA